MFLQGCFSPFLNRINGTKLPKVSHVDTLSFVFVSEELNSEELVVSFVSVSRGAAILEKFFLMALMELLTLFRMGGQKGPPTSFSTVTSTNVGISPQNFLTFSFNSFATLV